MNHGLFTTYVRGCRCTPCREANRDHARDRQNYANNDRRELTPAERLERKACLICRTPVLQHPLKACWRTA